VELHPLVVGEWREDHCLRMPSLLWICDHADPGDPHPIATAVAVLRTAATDIDTGPPEAVTPDR